MSNHQSVEETVDFDIGSLKVECHWTHFKGGVRASRTLCGKVPAAEQHRHSTLREMGTGLPVTCPDCGAKTCESCAVVARGR